MSSITSQGKPHFATLDGLRGVAALSVVTLHWFEGLGFKFFGSSLLAVDFFFMLSGFVVAYSYEERLKKGFSFFKFMLLRIIRLHPMIILGALLGLLRFESKSFLDIGEFNIEYLGMFLKNILMIPEATVINLLKENNQAHFPLNQALWSLFFEFFAYIIFGLILFKLNTRAIFAITLISYIGFGSWLERPFGLNQETDELVIECYARVLFAFSMGVLFFRYSDIAINIGKKIPFSYLIFLPIFFVLPRDIMPWYFYLTGMLLIFPLAMAVGMSSKLEGTVSKISDFLGDISYPIYAIHVPIVWGMAFAFKKMGFDDPQQLVWFGLFVIPITIALSYFALKLYDEPVRKLLKQKVLA